MSRVLRMIPARPVMILAMTALIGGCTTASGPEGPFSPVQSLVAEKIRSDAIRVRTEQEADAARRRTQQLLARPLSPDAAVQIALLNNAGLQAAYTEIGLAEAHLIQESLPPNPRITLGRAVRGDEVMIERKLILDILGLATLPLRHEIAAERLSQTQLRAAAETIRIAVETRRAYYRTIAAKQLLDYLGEARSAAESASDLARKLGETGAWNKLDQAREHAFYAEIGAQSASAQQRYRSEREQLVRAMGLWGADLNFRLPSQLPNLPKAPKTLNAVESAAIKERIDIEIARRELALLAKTLGLTQATRFVNVFEVGAWRTTETGQPVERGIEIELVVPLFDFGQARVLRAEETYLQALHRLREQAVNARSQARDAYQTYRTAFDVARHYRDEIVPLRKTIAEEGLLRYNAMVADTFRLLADTRQTVASVSASIEAQRDFWLSSVDLFATVAGAGAGARTNVVMAAPAAEPPSH